MDLNLSNVLFTSLKTNSFSTKIRNNYDIAHLFKRKIKNLIKNEAHSVFQNFNLTRVIFKQDKLVAGDVGGFILLISLSGVFSILYQHSQQVTCLVNPSKENYFISASEDSSIKFYNFEEIESQKDFPNQNEPVSFLTIEEENKQLFSAGKSGDIFQWDIDKRILIKKFNLEKIQISTLLIKKDKKQLLIGYENAKIFFYEIQTQKKNKEIKTNSKSIKCMILDNNEEQLIIGCDEGLIEIWNCNNHKFIKSLSILIQSNITDLCLIEEQNLLLAVNEKCALIRYDLINDTFQEQRKIQQQGNPKFSKGVDNFTFYISGIKNDIEEWNFNTNSIINTFHRNEIPSLVQYKFFYYKKQNQKLYVFEENGIYITYEINDESLDCQISERNLIPSQKPINKIFINEFENFIYYSIEENVFIFDLNQKKQILSFNSNMKNIIKILVMPLAKALIVIDSNGEIIQFDLKTEKIIKIIPDLSQEETIEAFLSKQEKNIFLIKKQGNLIIKNLTSKQSIQNKILNDNNISTFYYDDLKQQFFTADIGGIIIQTIITGEERITVKQLLDKDLEIVSLTSNKSGNLLAFSLINMKIYLYDIKSNYIYEKIGSSYQSIKYLFFSENDYNLFYLSDSGSLQYYSLQQKPKIKKLQFFDNQQIDAITLNEDHIFLCRNKQLEIWNMEDLILEKNFTTNYDNVLKIMITSDGKILISSHENGVINFLDVLSYEQGKQITLEEKQIMDFNIFEQKLIIGLHEQKFICYNIQTKEILFTHESDQEIEKIAMIGSELICIQIAQGIFSIYDILGNHISYIGKKSNFLKGFVWTKDYKQMILAYRDSTIQIWDIMTGENIQNFEKSNNPINDIQISEDQNTLYVLGHRGDLFHYSILEGKIYKQEILANITKTFNFMRFNKTILFVYENQPYFFNIEKNLNFQEKQYIRQSFIHYGQTNSEKDFLKQIQLIQNSYHQNHFLKTYFNPIFACALFNYQNSLQTILKEKYAEYPLLNDENQVSPIVLAIQLEYINLAEIILQKLALFPYHVYFTNREMKALLDSKYEFTHKYLPFFIINCKRFTGTNINIPILSKLNEKFRLESDYKYHFTPMKYQLLTAPKIEDEEEDKKDNKKRRETRLLKNVKTQMISEKQSANTSYQSTQYSNENEHLGELVKSKKKRIINLWQPTQFLRINGKYSFEIGTKESIDFLNHYKNSNVKEFILSNWKHIIDYKWKIIFKRLILPSVVNWAHLLFFNLAIAITDNLGLFIIDYIFIFIIFLYELLSMYSSGLLNYFTSFNNIFDMVIIFLCAFLNYFTYQIEGKEQRYNETVLEVLQIIALGIIYYRALTFLRILKTFRNVIDLLISVVFTIFSLLIIIIIWIGTVSVLFVKAHPEEHFYQEFLKFTLFSLLGEFEYKTDDFNSLGWILYVFNYILLPLILINFLIAKMSNKYNQLEEAEEVTSYKEKAELISEIEYFSLIRSKNKKETEIGKNTGFTFIARWTTDNQEDDSGETSFQNSFDALQNKIDELHKMFSQEINNSNNRFNYLKQNIDTFKVDYDSITEEIDKLKNEQFEGRKYLNEKLKLVEDQFKLFQAAMDQEIERINHLDQEEKKQKEKSFWQK